MYARWSVFNVPTVIRSGKSKSGSSGCKLRFKWKLCDISKAKQLRWV